MNELPWSNGQMRKLGKCIQSGDEPATNLPTYEEVMMHFNDVAVWVQGQIMSLDWESLLGGRNFEVTSRPKTIDTLKQKLDRDPTKPLQVIQDIAGVRFEAEMTLDEQDAVVTAIVGLFGHNPEECVKDLRVEDHSGYRAVHIWLRLPTRVEVQVRTHLQSAWANAYESLADVLGRDIRYGVMPTNESDKSAVENLQWLAVNVITEVEKLRNEEVKSDAELAEVVRMFDDYPAALTSKELERRDRLVEKHNVAKVNRQRLEDELTADLIKHKGSFDKMRENGRD